MTATSREQVKLPPRPLIRTFWSLHKAIYRLTGGRFGLQQPERGAKFGMLRLHTVGRRSGRSRIAMIGYFEDGTSLVTLAMNGWGETEPAWWLNLQADPSATVDTAEGSLTVRARAAIGAERDRLWAAFRDYPGWGADLGALSARRPGETAIVVLEPAAESPR
jgi:deazaflavin-dependent oxidoreductase (nitroreductase family)